MNLAVRCYEFTRGFPKEEMYSMTSQIRRSATSIAANIAEGHGRETTGAFVQFLRNAQGSLKELETHVLLSQRVELAGAAACNAILADCDQIGRMLRSMIRSLQQRMTEARA
jgi:four helix bundle protein